MHKVLVPSNAGAVAQMGHKLFRRASPPKRKPQDKNLGLLEVRMSMQKRKEVVHEQQLYVRIQAAKIRRSRIK